jgi:ribosomal-protein-alanine N-acetyltransferase
MNLPPCLETPRLRIRWLEAEDAGFILRLVNDPAWLRFIGDRQVANMSDARAYIEEGPRTMYRQFGFGLYRVALRECDTPIGISGLLRRETLPDADLGYALLPEYRNRGYALEAASAVLRHSLEELAQPRIAAIVSTDNEASTKLLGKLGFHFERRLQMELNRDPVDLYMIDRET